MRTLDPGHKYLLDNLRANTQTVIVFMKDPELHNGDGHDGPSCQEYLRAIIDRVQVLDAEKPWSGNRGIINCLRQAIAGFEARAFIRKVEKEDFAIENLPLAADGHIKMLDKSV